LSIDKKLKPSLQKGNIYFFAMANIDQHKPGSFCWIELSTTDQNAAKKFYSSLFGWAVKDEPMGPDSVYTMFQLGARDAGAACTLWPEQRAAGVPPHWMLYIAVENADASASHAAKAGGTVLKPAFDVMDVGRMAVLQDPTGATFCIWQANKSKGIQIAGEPGTLCWADLNTPDPARARQFYADVFGWKYTEDTHSDPPSGYLHIQNGDEFIGGIPPVRPESSHSAHIPAHWMSYFLVAECDASAAKAKELGARFCLEPMTMEGIGRMSILTDPQGAAFAMFQPLPRKP
jgi:predicted enzyme related to lactoylglutathione lyase